MIIFLELTRGLRLNQSIYHSQFPPILQISSEEDKVDLKYGEDEDLNNLYKLTPKENQHGTSTTT